MNRFMHSAGASFVRGTRRRRLWIVMSVALLALLAWGGTVSATKLAKHPKPEPGVLITGVGEDTPAAQSGLARGDILLAIDGDMVNTAAELNHVILMRNPGDTLELTVKRGEEEVTLTVTLGERDEQPLLGVATYRSEDGDLMLRPDRFFERGGRDVWMGPRHFGGLFDQDEGMGVFPFMVVGGAEIIEVDEDGPAADAGLTANDVIIAVDGIEVAGFGDLVSALLNHRPGGEARLTVDRGGEEITIAVTLDAHPNDEERPYLGVQVAPFLWEEDGFPYGEDRFHFEDDGFPYGEDRFPVEDDGFVWEDDGQMMFDGVEVMKVRDDGPAAAAGLRVGDLIIAVDETEIGFDDLAEAVANYSPGDEVELNVDRDGEIIELTVTLGAHPNDEERPYLGVQVAPFLWEEDGFPYGEDRFHFEDDGFPYGEDRFPVEDDGFVWEDDGQMMFDGVEVMKVRDDGPAAAAGLRAGDLIIAVDETEIGFDDLAEAVANYSPGDEVELNVDRDGEIIKLTVTLGAHPDDEERPYLGVQVAPFLWEEDGHRFEREFDDRMPGWNRRGFRVPYNRSFVDPFFRMMPDAAVVMQVQKDGPAAAAGLRAGDLIIAVDETEVAGFDDLAEAAANYSPGDEVELTIDRDGEIITTTVTLGAYPDDEETPYLGAHIAPGGPSLWEDDDFLYGEGRFHFEDGGFPYGRGRIRLPDQPKFEGPFFFRTMPDGVPVMGVLGESPAADAGLERGDVIIALGERQIIGFGELVKALAKYSPGDEVELTVDRLGEIITTTVTLGAHPDDATKAYLGVASRSVDLHERAKQAQEKLQRGNESERDS